MKHYEDKQRQMSDAEVMTTSIVAGLFFSGNMEKSRIFLQDMAIFRRCWRRAVSTVANTRLQNYF